MLVLVMFSIERALGLEIIKELLVKVDVAIPFASVQLKLYIKVSPFFIELVVGVSHVQTGQTRSKFILLE